MYEDFIHCLKKKKQCSAYQQDRKNCQIFIYESCVRENLDLLWAGVMSNGKNKSVVESASLEGGCLFLFNQKVVDFILNNFG